MLHLIKLSHSYRILFTRFTVKPRVLRSHPNTHQRAPSISFMKLMCNVLNSLAWQFIPAHGHSFDKFWLSQEMDMLKDNGIIWELSGKRPVDPTRGISLNCAKKINPHINKN